MNTDSDHQKVLLQSIEEKISHRLHKLNPIRDALKDGRIGEDDICYLSSGERVAVLIAAEREQALESSLFAFLRLDDDLQAYVLLSRERARFIGSRIAYDL